MADTEKITLLEPGNMVNDMVNPNSGYTDKFYNLRFNLRVYAKFIGAMVRLGILSVREGQILASNYSQREFEKIINGEIY